MPRLSDRRAITQYFVSFKKGKGSGTVATFLSFTGTLLPMDQVKKVAQQIASGM